MAPSPFNGAYRKTLDQEWADFSIKAGYPAEVVKPMVGATIQFRVRHQGKAFVVTYTCKEVPAFNSTDVLSTERDNYSTSMAFGATGAGDKVKVEVSLTGDNSLVGICHSSMLGKIEYHETYTKEGCSFLMKVNGLEMKDMWPRVADITGRFKYDRMENMEEYLKTTKQPLELIDAVKGSTLNFLQDGDTYTVHDYIGGTKATNSFKLGEPWVYSFPGFDDWKRRSLTIESPMGMKYTGIDKDGQIEITEVTYEGDEMCMHTVHQSTGVSAKLIMKRFDNIYGKWKFAACTGTEELLLAAGVEKKLAVELANDQGALLTIEPVDGGRKAHYTYASKCMPMDATFTWGEVYEYRQEGIPEAYMTLETLDGDTQMSTAIGPKTTTVSKITYFDDFAVQETTLEGEGIKETVTATIVLTRVQE